MPTPKAMIMIDQQISYMLVAVISPQPTVVHVTVAQYTLAKYLATILSSCIPSSVTQLVDEQIFMYIYRYQKQPEMCNIQYKLKNVDIRFLQIKGTSILSKNKFKYSFKRLPLRICGNSIILYNRGIQSKFICMKLTQSSLPPSS